MSEGDYKLNVTSSSTTYEVSVNPKTVFMHPDDGGYKLYAGSSNSSGMSWSSSDLSLATVDANGYITAVGTGTVMIRAASLNSLMEYDSARVFVTPEGDYEPNNSFSEATPIDVGVEYQSHTIDVSSDNDYFQYAVVQGYGYTIRLENETGSNVRFYVYDHLQKTLSGWHESQTNYICQTTGVNYIRVYRDGGREVGNYTIRVIPAYWNGDVSLVWDGLYEPTPTSYCAYLLATDGVDHFNTINSGEDNEDYFRFTASKGNSYTIALSEENAANVRFYLYYENKDHGLEIISGWHETEREFNCEIYGSYVVRIYRESGLSEGDYKIRIFGPQVLPLTLISPVGDERWDVGSQQVISWTSQGIDEINIELSTDNGANFFPIACNINAADGEYNWIVPDAVALNKSFIRISDAEGHATATNVSPFEIVPNVTVIITHGFTLDLLFTTEWKQYKWQFAMADAISADRQICFVHNGRAYRCYLTYEEFKELDDGLNIDAFINAYCWENLILDPNKDVVFVLDWIDGSDSNTHGYAEAAANAFFAVLLGLTEQYPWLLNELHFIGHSRGTVVNSEIIQRLFYTACNGQIKDGIHIDKEIQMTTLDAHPAGHWSDGWEAMNDDWVNDFNGIIEDIGVVGWKAGFSGEYQVAYIDNYYELIGSTGWLIPYVTPNPFTFIGLANYYGCPGPPLSLDITPFLWQGGSSDELNRAHAMPRVWYKGTVDLNVSHPDDEFGDGLLINREDWYTNSGGNEGYYYSITRAGDPSQIYGTDVNSLIDVKADYNYNDSLLIFNGSFIHNPGFGFSEERIPGWEFQGGGGSAPIKRYEKFFWGAVLLENSHLYLEKECSRTSNYFYIPNNLSTIWYRMKVKSGSKNDIFKIYIGNNPVGVVPPIVYEKNYEWYPINVSAYQGTSQTITFELVRGGQIADAKILIDDVGFCKPRRVKSSMGYYYTSTPSAKGHFFSSSASASSESASSQIQYGARDHLGNYTGMLDENTIVEEIPGSKAWITQDSVNSLILITLDLPEAQDGEVYTYESHSLGYTGSYFITLEDITDYQKTKNMVYDSINATSSSNTLMVFATLSDSTKLYYDGAGDGTYEDTLSGNYLDHYKLIREIEGNGLVIPADTSIADLDTIIVMYGDSITFIISPDYGYEIEDVYVDGQSIGPVTEYTFIQIRADHTIAVNFIRSQMEYQNTAAEGWNLVGLPYEVSNRYYLYVYPDAVENTLYSFDGSYQYEDSLDIGAGYWLRFATESTISVQGFLLDSLAMNLESGWHLISGPSCNLPVTAISDPDSIIMPGTIYGFNGSYFSADTIKQGFGYWLRTDTLGTIFMDGKSYFPKKTESINIKTKLSSFSSITITDAAENQQILYFGVSPGNQIFKYNFTLPPLPPIGAFDARYEDDSRVTSWDEAVIKVQTVNFPLSIKAQNLPIDDIYQYALESGGKINILSEGQTLVMSTNNDGTFRLIRTKVIPLSFTVSQNYPNPFNPLTLIKFGLPEGEKVEIIIYNTLGQKVKTLLSEFKEAGYHTISWDGTTNAGKKVSTGIYYYRVEAGKHMAIRKMLLLK